MLIVRRAKLYFTASGIITLKQVSHLFQCDDIRGCKIQFCPPDDEQMCSKHVEASNKFIIKNLVHKLVDINK